jgi:hypothetical protein
MISRRGFLLRSAAGIFVPTLIKPKPKIFRMGVDLAEQVVPIWLTLPYPPYIPWDLFKPSSIIVEYGCDHWSANCYVKKLNTLNGHFQKYSDSDVENRRRW